MIKHINRPIPVVLLILAILSIASGFGYGWIHSQENNLLQLGYLALFYMPLPFYSLVVFSVISGKDNVFKYIKSSNVEISSILFTIRLFLLWSVVLFLFTIALSNLLPNTFSKLATSNDQIISQMESLVGDGASENMNLPPSPLLLIPLAFVSAIISGFSINLIFALGEEVLWRGFMWEKLKHLPDIKVSLIIGFIWGVWHLPLILQGYNYGDQNRLLGCIMFTLFCITFSLIFTFLMRKTNSTILAGSLHGMFNAFAGIFIIVLVDPNPFLDGAIGLISIISLLITFIIYRGISHNLNRA